MQILILPALFFTLLFLLSASASSLTSLAATTTDTLLQGSSLSVEKYSTDALVSSNGDFTAGFFSVGDNAFCFSIWFTRSKQPTVVWMANRDQPVNGKQSKLSLLNNGNLILMDAGGTTIWTTSTTLTLSSPFHLQHLKLTLTNNGNLILITVTPLPTTIWQSFDSPTDTLLQGQPVTEHARLISSRTTTNYSSGFYNLYFDNDNTLRLLYKGASVTSVYWPPPWLLAFTAGRTTYNVSKIAVLDHFGHFTSSDAFRFVTTDYGTKLYRLVKMDPDGNLRAYSFNRESKTWEVTWQAIAEPCSIHGLCGANSMCSYHPVNGRTCYCLKGYKVKNPNDWSQGCEPDFKPSNLSCNNPADDTNKSLSSSSSYGFLLLKSTEFYGYDWNVTSVTSLKECLNLCLELCDNCKAVQFKFNEEVSNYSCYPKPLLLNGRTTPNFNGDIYLKLPEAMMLHLSSSNRPHNKQRSPLNLNCSIDLSQPLNRFYQKPTENSALSFFLWFVSGIAVFETSIIFLMWFFLFRTKKQNTARDEQKHLLGSATGFQRYTYAELKSATNDFSEEIGRGAGGVVYKGTLLGTTDHHRVAAIKCLSEAHQGEAEFLAELSTIGMLNHMNLIDMWGYCVEGKHRLLVYEYMEHGNLAENLSSNTLDWNKRFNIAVGTAKGLAYLHEECLEWVLHCDVKPQNILLDSNFQPKVADFGLSKLLNRDQQRGNSVFSRIRGTRGYMAPEWVYNLPITSKVDVYSYGIVVLEMVTGKSIIDQHHRLLTCVMDKVKSAPTTMFWIEEIVDPNLEGCYNVMQVETLVRVALQCVQDDMNERPSMSQVVEMLHQSRD